MIYIIDDDAYVRRGFQMLFKSAGFETEAFESAVDFINECKPLESDMLILDMHMQGMNGCDLLKEFGKKKFKMHVIAVTAYDSKAARDCARDYGVVAFLRKPADGDALLDLIRFTYAVKLDSN